MNQILITIFVILAMSNMLGLMLSFLHLGACCCNPQARMELLRRFSIRFFSTIICGGEIAVNFLFLNEKTLFMNQQEIISIVLAINIIALLVIEWTCHEVLELIDETIVYFIYNVVYMIKHNIENKDNNCFNIDSYDFLDTISYTAKHGEIQIGEFKVSSENKDLPIQDSEKIIIERYKHFKCSYYMETFFFGQRKDISKKSSARIIKQCNYSDEEFVDRIKKDLTSKFGEKEFIIIK